MVNLFCKPLIRFACIMAFTTAAVAQDTDFARLTGLQIIGTWTEDDRYGEIRLLSQQDGFETVFITLSIDWVYIDPDTGTAQVLATRRLSDCVGLPIRNFTITSAVQNSFGDPVQAELTDGTTVIGLKIAEPGNLEMVGC